MSRNIVIHPNRGLTGATEQPFITFSGLTAGSISLVVEDDGSITFDGDTGSLFGITDNKDGLLHSVNDVSGLPIFQVYADNKIIMGKWDDPAMTLTSGGTININLDNVGSGTPLFNLGVDSSGDIVTGTTGGGSFTGNTSGDCITDLYVSNIYGCSPITFNDTISFNGSAIDADSTKSFIFGDSHVLSGSSVTHGTGMDSNVILGGSGNKITPLQTGLYNTIIGGHDNEIGQVSRVDNNVILGSTNSLLGGAFGSTGGSSILGGNGHICGSATNGSMIGGDQNYLSDNTNRSVILGGLNITGDTSDTVYVPNLNIGTVGSGTPNFNLGLDSSGNVVTGTTGGGTVTGTGTTNYVSKWSSSSGQSNSLIRDDATSLGIGIVPTSTDQLGMLTSNNDNSLVIQNTTVTTAFSYGIRVNNFAVGATGSKIGIWAAGNTVDEDESSFGGVFTAGGANFSSIPNEQVGVRVAVGGNQGFIHESTGVDIEVVESHSGDTYGLKILTTNAGIGDSYGIQIKDGTQSNGYVLTCDALGNGSWQASAGGGTDTVSATTTTIDFTAPKIFHKYTNQATGDILEDLTGAKLGITQKIYHNDVGEPAYPAGWVLMGDGVYFTSQLNIIYCEWAEGSRVEYWYVQEQ